MGKVKNLIKLFIILIFFIAIFGCKYQNETFDPKIPGGEGNPQIEFTYVPQYNSFENLKGQVWHVDPTNFKIIVYIYVSGWWTKPYMNNPLTTIQMDGSWECDITTGGIDEQATKIIAFLVTNEYNPNLLSGDSTIPMDLYQNSLSYVEITREDLSRVISFSGYEWKVKSSYYQVGPGPNYFSDSSKNVWIENDQLHLKIDKNNERWYCAEVILKENLGYGRYCFYLASKLDQLDENVVLGLFTWDDAYEYNHREIDIEFSKWGQPENMNSQYVVQPWNNTGNLFRFDTHSINDSSFHCFEWRNTYISFQSANGYFTTPLDSNNVSNSWLYVGEDIPIPGDENVRINLWLFNGISPSDNKEVEIIIDRFEFLH